MGLILAKAANICSTRKYIYESGLCQYNPADLTHQAIRMRRRAMPALADDQPVEPGVGGRGLGE